MKYINTETRIISLKTFCDVFKLSKKKLIIYVKDNEVNFEFERELFINSLKNIKNIMTDIKKEKESVTTLINKVNNIIFNENIQILPELNKYLKYIYELAFSVYIFNLYINLQQNQQRQYYYIDINFQQTQYNLNEKINQLINKKQLQQNILN